MGFQGSTQKQTRRRSNRDAQGIDRKRPSPLMWGKSARDNGVRRCNPAGFSCSNTNAAPKEVYEFCCHSRQNGERAPHRESRNYDFYPATAIGKNTKRNTECGIGERE